MFSQCLTGFSLGSLASSIKHEVEFGTLNCPYMSSSGCFSFYVAPVINLWLGPAAPASGNRKWMDGTKIQYFMVNFSFTSKDKKAQTVFKRLQSVLAAIRPWWKKRGRKMRDTQDLNHYFVTTTIGKKKTQLFLITSPPLAVLILVCAFHICHRLTMEKQIRTSLLKHNWTNLISHTLASGKPLRRYRLLLPTDAPAEGGWLWGVITVTNLKSGFLSYHRTLS